MSLLQNSNAIESGGYLIQNSLRFQSASSQYLSRTPASAGNRKTWTFSAWIKRGALGSRQAIFGASPTSSPSDSTQTFIEWRNDDTIVIDANTINWRQTTPVYRDPSAWYHLVWVLDTTQATATDRTKIYVNGVQITSFTTNNTISLNADLGVNATNIHGIGVSTNTTNLFLDGYMAEVNFIDGQALTPSSFGETNTLTGQWVAKKYTGTYGTNGFYLPFSNGTSTTTLGADSSGNGNNWTLINFTRSAGVSDCWMYDVPSGNGGVSGAQPSSNYCVMNPLNQSGTATPSLANLRVTQATNNAQVAGSIGMSSGKWYYEHTITALGGENSVGIGLAPVNGWAVGNTTGQYGYYSNGNKYLQGVASAYGASWTTGDVIGVAYDADTGSLTFYKNGVSQGVATTGLTGIFFALAATRTAGGTNISDFNFGQRSFAYTPPTGFKALCTANLPASTIVKGNQYMDATLYTGTNAAQSITNSAGFSPDIVWAKCRSSAFSNSLYDAVRGARVTLSSNATNAENTEAAGYSLTSFNSNGFSVGIDNAGIGSVNYLSQTYVAWQWDAGSSTVTNTNGSISSQVRANTTAGVSVVTWTGAGSAATVGHGLGVAPKMFITKRRDTSENWNVYHASIGNTGGLSLNITNGTITNIGYWNNTSPTANTLSIGTYQMTNGATYVGYAFAEIAGFSKFGSYTGNGSADGSFVYCGFRPKFVMIKVTNIADHWIIIDSARNTYNVVNSQLYPSLSNAEATATVCDFLSNGFKLRVGTEPNGNGNNYIYMAFAENPFANSNSR